MCSGRGRAAMGGYFPPQPCTCREQVPHRGPHVRHDERAGGCVHAKGWQLRRWGGQPPSVVEPSSMAVIEAGLVLRLDSKVELANTGLSLLELCLQLPDSVVDRQWQAPRRWLPAMPFGQSVVRTSYGVLSRV